MYIMNEIWFITYIYKIKEYVYLSKQTFYGLSNMYIIFTKVKLKYCNVVHVYIAMNIRSIIEVASKECAVNDKIFTAPAIPARFLFSLPQRSFIRLNNMCITIYLSQLIVYE